MTCQDAVARAIKILTTTKYTSTGVMIKKVNMLVFPYSIKKSNSLKEYIVVNTLGFPHDILQVGYVNINIHVEDKQGLIDNKRLYQIYDMVTALMDANTPNDEDDYIDYELINENIFQGENGDHYLSLKYKVAMLN